MSEPIGNTEQLAVAWIEHHKAGDNLNWEEVNHPYAKATPLYTHPIRELSDEEIKECCKKVGVIIHVEYLPSWIKELSDELIKASRGEK